MDTWHLMSALGDSANPARVLRVIKTPAPVAGADMRITVPGHSIWRPISLVTTLVTSAAVANRRPSLQITDGSDSLAFQLTPAVIAASLTTRLSWFGPSAPSLGAANDPAFSQNLPDMVLPGGFTIGTLTGLVDVADQYGTSLLWVEEYLEQPFGAKQERLLNWLEHLAETSLAAEGSN